MIVDSVRCVAAAIPLLLKYQGTGKIHAVIQPGFERGMLFQRLDLDGYLGLVQFGEGPLPFFLEQTDSKRRGRGLVIQVSRNEFYVIGANYRLLLRPKLPPDKMLASSFVSDLRLRLFPHLRVDEVHFDQNGEFVVDRRRNGDEVSRGVWVEANTGVVRVIMCD